MTDKRFPGMRVAVVSADMKTFLGYGVYEGDFFHPILSERWAKVAETHPDLSPDERVEMARAIRAGEMAIARNPCILLDSGERVWGCECWWGPEDSFRDNGWAERYGV